MSKILKNRIYDSEVNETVCEYLEDHMLTYYLVYLDTDSVPEFDIRFKNCDFNKLKGKTISNIKCLSVITDSYYNEEVKDIERVFTETVVIICEDGDAFILTENHNTVNGDGEIIINAGNVIFKDMEGCKISKACISTGCDGKQSKDFYILKIKDRKGVIVLGGKDHDSNGLIFKEFKYKRKIKVKKLK